MGDWLGRLASTALNTVVGGIIALSLTCFYIAATLLAVKIDPTVFGLMLTFSAAYSGLSVTQFKVKRDTEIITPPSVPAKDAAAAAAGTPIPMRVRDVRKAERATDRFNPAPGVNLFPDRRVPGAAAPAALPAPALQRIQAEAEGDDFGEDK